MLEYPRADIERSIGNNSVEVGASEWLADPDFVAQDLDLWTTRETLVLVTPATLIFGGHVDRASVRMFCVAEKCWSAAFRFNSALNSAFSASIS